MNQLNNLFGKSPFNPIQKHIQKAEACAQGLRPFIAAVIAEDWDAALAAQQHIVTLENEADELKKHIRLNMPRSLFMPVPRPDLLDLVTMQDRIANCAKDVAGLMLGRKMRIPDVLTTSMTEYVDLAVRTASQARGAIDELDELLETGFRGREVELVEKMIEDLDQLESAADQLQISIRGDLYSIERDLPPVDVMFLYRIIELIGELSDKSQKVGSRLQVIIAR
nr:TIGR00153 family protein [Spongiibacter thalassae]